MNITIRNAGPDDARFVAWAVLTALDLDETFLPRFAQSTSDPDSLYSWRHALIAEADGNRAGCIVAYPGDDYDRLRRYTWPRIWQYGGGRPDNPVPDIDSLEPETSPGEYYLDTLAVSPEYRGHDLGKMLIEAALRQGKDAGFRHFALIADIDKTRLIRYYNILGFKSIGEMDFFGHRYHKMRYDLTE